MNASVPTSFLLGVLLLLQGCGGDSSSDLSDTNPEFRVPSMPVSFRDGSENNQPPADEILEPEFVTRTPVNANRSVTVDQAALETQALALARAYLTSEGFSGDDDVAITQFLLDEFGSAHVKMEQIYKGVPVNGAGLIGHIYGDIPNEVSANLIKGISVDTTPTVTAAAALDDALSRYPLPRDQVTQRQRLIVLPDLTPTRVRNDSPGEDNAADYDFVLSGVQLAWEVVLAPILPDKDDATYIAAKQAAAPVNTETAADLRIVRDENTRVGSIPRDDPAVDAFTTMIDYPPIRYRIDGHSGALIDEAVLIDHADVNSLGRGIGYYNGAVDITTVYSESGDRYYLRDRTRPGSSANTVWDAHDVDTHDTDDMDVLADKDDLWGDGQFNQHACTDCTTRQTPAVDVAYGVQLSWDMFKNVLYRWGLDNNGTSIHTCVHYDVDYSDAHYNHESKLACFGNGASSFAPGNYSLNTVGHELGHNFWHASGIGAQETWSRALNEGHGDIMGGLVDHYQGTGSTNVNDNQIRHFPNFSAWKSRDLNPAGYTEDSGGKQYTGQSVWSSALFDMPEHVAGIPFARAFIYLAEGAPAAGDPLASPAYPAGLGGIGLTKAAHIWKNAIAYYVAGEPSYAVMMNAFTHTAAYLYGLDSMEYKATKRAFRGINVGLGASDTSAPEISYAKIFNIDYREMTAMAYASVKEDAGIRQMRINGHMNNGRYDGDIFMGYVDIARVPVGINQSFEFEVEDGVGKTAKVSRVITKAHDRNLIKNGDFEDGFTDWQSFSGDTDYTGDNYAYAFIGDGYLGIRGVDTVYQEISLQPDYKNVSLSLRLLSRNFVGAHDSLAVQVLDTGNQVKEVFLVQDRDAAVADKKERDYLNKGYIRKEFDLSAYVGQTIRIAFANVSPEPGSIDPIGKNRARFLLDQVVVSYEQEVFVDVPKITLREWDNTVSFELPKIEGVDDSQIGSVMYYVDDNKQGMALSTTPNNYPATVFIDDLKQQNAHWVGAAVRGLDNKIIAYSNAVWFAPKPFKELLVNGGFEDGLWNFDYDVPPKIELVENDPNAQKNTFDGERALRLGYQGVDGMSTAGQTVAVPSKLKTLKFSLRFRIAAESGEDLDDQLWLELWDAKKFEVIEKHLITEATTTPGVVGLDDYFAKYRRREISLTPANYSGKEILVLIRAYEDAGKKSAFIIDNASLRYTQYGVNIGY